jgi:hypothetical protein
MKHRSSLTVTALCALGLSALLLEACGGRVQTLRELEEDPESGGRSTSSAGATGRAGAPSNGGAPSSAGAASGVGATSSGGASSAGGASGGGCSRECATPACPPGSFPAFEPGACCAICVSNCGGACPLIKCAAGTRPETPPGSCCPICVDDGNAACRMGRTAYASQRETLLTKYSYGCASASECVVIAPVNSCESGCSYAAVWYGIADSFQSNLSNMAHKFCETCQGMPEPPCAPPLAPRCIGGQCQL